MCLRVTVYFFTVVYMLRFAFDFSYYKEAGQRFGRTAHILVSVLTGSKLKSQELVPASPNIMTSPSVISFVLLKYPCGNICLSVAHTEHCIFSVNSTLATMGTMWTSGAGHKLWFEALRNVNVQ